MKFALWFIVGFNLGLLVRLWAKKRQRQRDRAEKRELQRSVDRYLAELEKTL